MRRIYRIRRKLAWCVRRRGWVMFRSLVVHLVALGLVALGVLARTAESTDAAIQRRRPLELDGRRPVASELGPKRMRSVEAKSAKDIFASL